MSLSGSVLVHRQSELLEFGLRQIEIVNSFAPLLLSQLAFLRLELVELALESLVSCGFLRIVTECSLLMRLPLHSCYKSTTALQTVCLITI